MNTILVCPADWSLENTFDIYGNCYLFIIFIYLLHPKAAHNTSQLQRQKKHQKLKTKM